MASRRWTRGRRITGLLVLAGLIVGSLAWRASWAAHRLLRSWTASTIREKSGSVYELAVGQVRFYPWLRQLSVDSLRLTTSRTANGLRPRPLATIALVFRHCTISGVHLITLAVNGGLVADAFGCDTVNARFVVPRGEPSTVAQTGLSNAVLRLQESITLPSFAPRLQIANIDFPQVVLDFHIEQDGDGDSHAKLDHFKWRMKGFVMDPSNVIAASFPLFSRSIELSADNLVVRFDSINVLRVASVAGSLTDSTLNLRDLAFGPDLGRAAYARARPYRRRYATVRVASVAIRGADVGALLFGHGLRARRALIDSMSVDVSNDHRLPPKVDAPKRKRTPQEWIADLNRPVHVDSVALRHGRVVYRSRSSDREQWGVVTFGRINALALDVNTSVKDSTTRAPMRLAATAYLQDAGLLSARFVVPLRAPRFEMTYRGSLGPMAADRFNAYLVETSRMRIEHGEISGITFQGTVSQGSARGTITPLYSNFSVAVTQAGSTGILGSSGFMGVISRKVASFAGNWQRVNNANPDDKTHDARVGEIRHTFTTNESLPDFLWNGLRDGLLMVVRR